MLKGAPNIPQLTNLSGDIISTSLHNTIYVYTMSCIHELPRTLVCMYSSTLKADINNYSSGEWEEILTVYTVYRRDKTYIISGDKHAWTLTPTLHHIINDPP